MKTMRIHVFFALTLIAIFFSPWSQAADTKSGAPIAKIGPTVLTEEDFRKDMGMSLYELENQIFLLKKSWVDQKTKTQYMSLAAKEAKISVAEWQKREIDSKVAQPTQQEIDQFAPRFAMQGSTMPPTNDQYTSMKEK